MMSFALPASAMPTPKKAKPLVPPPRVVLPVLREPVAPGAVRDPLDRFRCEPYAALLTGAACVDRQARAETQSKQATGLGAGRNSSEKAAARVSCDYAKCRGCAVGAGILKRLGASKNERLTVAEKNAARMKRIAEAAS